MNRDELRINNIEGALLHCETQDLYETLEDAVDLKRLIRGEESKEFIAGALYTLDTLFNIILSPECYFDNDDDEPD